MDSLHTVLAKLVLGYLKAEKCKTAYKEFIKTSPSLRQLDVTHNKYIATRFQGLALEDILTEYSDILQIVQGRLEATNYYNEFHRKESLVEQLLYLLNSISLSRPSTPCYSTPHGSLGGEKSPSHVDHSDVDATRADALPGNIPRDQSLTPNPKNFNKHGNPGPTTSSPIEKNRSELFNTEILAENLLENKEFHEKIAQTINKVVERQFDSTVKEVMQETEQDPIFDKILEEIIGTSNNMMEISKESGSNNTITSTNNISQDKITDERFNSTDTLTKLQKCDNINPDIDSSNNSKNAQQLLGKNQEILDRNMDKYIITNQCNTSACIQNPVYINTVTGVLIPPITTVIVNKSQPSAVLSEQDIMKMPIILNADAHTSESVITNKKKGPKSAKTIFPKPKIELAPDAPGELKEYFTNYKPEVPKQISIKKSTGLKHVIYPKTSRKSPNPVKKQVTNSGISNKKEMPKINANLENEVIEIPSSEHKSKTPLSLDLGKKVTPKSGSHIRNLDFSTPPKLNLGRRKSDAKTDENKAVKSLFKQTEAKAWDADLRSAIIKDETPKKDIVIKKCKKKAKKAKLNITEEDGLLLEAAIKTPVKTDHKKEVNKSEIPVIDTQSDNKKTATQVKTILSPSKLNASKSNIVETKSEEKFITPDIVKEHPSHLIKSNRNITPMLETPFKYQQPPKTPGVTTPMAFNDDGTPFTKMLDANLNGVDISSIETPSLLNTPGFPPNTPCIDLISPYENRPTDYSTGSSYYQPSDNEQNKILEAQIREVEKSSISPKVIIHEVVTVTDHLQIFNKNIIGKKNLNLIKNNMPESEHSQHSYSSSEEERGDSSLNWCDKESNDTIIFKKKSESPSRTYSLRTRSKKLNPIVSKALSSIKNSKNADKKKEIKTSSPKSKKSANKNSLENKKSTDSMCSEKRKSIDSKTSQTKDPNTIIKSDTSPDIEKSPAAAPSAKNTYIAPPGITSSQFSVLKELEKKRKRLVNSLKATTEPSPKHKKQTNGKFKIKPIAKVYTTKTGKKIESQRKRKRAKQLELLRNDLITSDDSELNISLSEDESAEKLTPRLDLKVDKLDKTASDVEAQNLIEGLKERGIHLMHNKTPKKKFYTKEEIINTSDIQLDSYDREVFDKKNVDGEDISIIYDGSHKPSKNLIDRQELEKTEYIGKLYLESIANEIDIHLKQTNFITLIDIKSDAPTSKQHKPKPTENRLDKKEGEKAKTIESKEKKGKNISLQNPTEIYNESERSPLTIQSNEPVCKTDKPKCTETKSNKKASDKAKIIESKDKHKEKRGKTDPQQNPIELHKKSMGALPTNHSNTPACKIDKPKCTESKSDKKAFEKTKTPDSKEKSKEKKGKSGKNTLEPFEESESSSLGNQSDKPKSIETKKECEKAKTIEEKEKSPQQTSIQLIKEHVSDLVSNQLGVDRDDEDLMNFALTGKEKVQEESSRSCKKRRLSDDSESENSRTKMLKTLDVDSFLNTIHHKDFRPKK